MHTRRLNRATRLSGSKRSTATTPSCCCG